MAIVSMSELEPARTLTAPLEPELDPEPEPEAPPVACAEPGAPDEKVTGVVPERINKSGWAKHFTLQDKRYTHRWEK